MSHTVRSHLRVRAHDYDAAIRIFVPHYDEMLSALVRWLDGHVPPQGLVVDLGAGTGALAERILAALPVRVCLVDIDEDMLRVAAERLARFADRIEPRHASFDDPIPPCDAVVASLSLHHVAERDAKLALYRRIREVLRPGGVLLVADATVAQTGPARERVFAEWARWMEACGVEPDEVQGHFAQWAEEDHYQPLAVELRLLAEAGFVQPDCFFRSGVATLFGGFVP
jgi:tRNA (cmo5U34)-methyltransferase